MLAAATLLVAVPERCVPPRARKRQEHKYSRIQEDCIADDRSKYPSKREGARGLTECKGDERDGGDGVNVVARILRFRENDVEVLAFLVPEECLPIRQGGSAYRYPQHPQNGCVFHDGACMSMAENNSRGQGTCMTMLARTRCRT